MNTSVNFNILRDKKLSLHLLDIYHVPGTVHKNKTPDSQVHNLVKEITRMHAHIHAHTQKKIWKNINHFQWLSLKQGL